MSYYVTTSGHGGITLFLADRSYQKSRWWITDLIGAIAFKSISAAKIQAHKLKYKNPVVIGREEAKVLEKRNMRIEIENDIHPFSPDGHGQW